MMCAGALVHARVERVVYGAPELKAGAFDSHPLVGESWLNHRIAWDGGVLQTQCSEMLSTFFAGRRSRQ